jgi:hypothetical protein
MMQQSLITPEEAVAAHDGSLPEVTLLLYRHMGEMGGIQAIIIRLVAELQAKSQPVFVVCDMAKPAIGLPDHLVINILAPPEAIVGHVARVLGRSRFRLTLAAMSAATAALAYIIYRDLSANETWPRPKFSFFVYHPRTLMFDDDNKSIHVLNRILVRLIGPDCLIFMNRECLLSHQTFLRCNLSRNLVLPVPVDRRPVMWQGGSQGPTIRIVVVGRIVAFKAYNFGLPRIVAALRRRGIDVECDIFGFGDMEPELRAAIAEHAVSAHVRFKGELDLRAFDNTVSGYDLFLGMGTAAIQAAQLGVPTILAVVDDPNGAHGYLFEAPAGNIGEADDTTPRQLVARLIEEFAGMEIARRLWVSDQCVAAANRHVVDNYVGQMPSNDLVRSGLRGMAALACCKLYIWLSRTTVLRRLVRRVWPVGQPR